MEKTATSSIESLYEKAKKYSQTSMSLFALNSIDKTADVLSSLTTRLIITMIVTMVTLLVSLGMAFFIGDLMHAYYLGFFIVSLFYLLLAFILFINRNKLIKEPVTNIVIAKLLKPNKSGFNFVKNINAAQNEGNA